MRRDTGADGALLVGGENIAAIGPARKLDMSSTRTPDNGNAFIRRASLNHPIQAAAYKNNRLTV